MRKGLIAGTILFLAILLIRAPAGLISLVIDDNLPVTLLEPQGTLWTGGAELLFNATSSGRVHWSFKPLTLMQGNIGYDLTLTGTSIRLDANLLTGLVSGMSRQNAIVSGSVDASFVNVFMAPYDIELSGEFLLNAVNISVQDRRIEQSAGSVTWDGGPVRYVLSGILHRTSLPAMHARLGPGPVAVVFALDDPTPLLHAELKQNGFARIGVTKYLTKILGNPWPGGDPDHEVVLEVEEQVF